MKLSSDIIKEILVCCDLNEMNKYQFVCKDWYYVLKVYKQTIAKTILNKYGYTNFKKNTNYYLLLKHFLNYDTTFKKDILNCYLDNKYTLCKFIINNNFDDVNLDKYLSLDINHVVDLIRDTIFIKNKKGDEKLLTCLIIWKMEKYIYDDPNDDLSSLSFVKNNSNYTKDILYNIRKPLCFFNMKNLKMNIICMLNEYRKKTYE